MAIARVESHTVGRQSIREARSLLLIAESESHSGAFGVLSCQNIKTRIANSIC